jgi:exodeoxyribonuclease VII small subunit
MAHGNKNGLHGENGSTFEDSFKRLQEVVQKLSEGNLTLQEALSAFEEGIELADRCGQMLDTAELRLKQVSAQSTRAAAESLAELEKVARESPAEDEGGESISVEFESYESRLVFDAPVNIPIPRSPGGNLAYSPLPGERPGSQRPPKGGKADSSGQAAFNPGDKPELDPLFDEED